MRTYSLAFTAILALTLILSESARAEVIISEIMYNPDKADTETGVFNKEWVEIYNTGVLAVDLSGWTFEDIQDMDAATPIPNGTMISPGEAIVLTGDSAIFDVEWGSGINRIELDNFPSLSNSPSVTNENLALKDNFGAVKDAVNYDDEGDWPTDVSDGPSIYARPDFLGTLSNNYGSHWASSTPAIEGAFRNMASPFGGIASPGFVATENATFPDFTPSPDAAWSMVIFPDTQNYVKTQSHLPQLVDMAEWVRDNRDEFKIQVVLQEGDIVNRSNNENPTNENPATLQWQNARAAMSILDGEVPYIMAVGNHDVEDPPTRLNEFFSTSDNPLNDPLQGGILKGTKEPGKLENAYYEMAAPDGRKLLVFSLAWDPQPEHLNWANQVAGQSKYADHTAILLTHSYLSSSGSYAYQGNVLWNGLVKGNENFEMVFNGHVGGDGTGYLVSTGDEGNDVHQMVFNTQFEGNGGNGWLRVIEFLDDGVTVRVRTFSPTFGYIRDDIANAFTFEISPFTAFLPGDFNEDGIVDAADYTVYRDNLGSNNALPNDGGLGTPVGSAHYNLWVANFGDTYANNSQAIPEPGSAMLFCIAGLFSFLSQRFRVTKNLVL